MTLNEYWDKVKHLAQYEKSTYPIKGLAIEVAECLEIYVKNERKPKPPEQTESMLVDELGDVLWFLCEIHKNNLSEFIAIYGSYDLTDFGNNIEYKLWICNGFIIDRIDSIYKNNGSLFSSLPYVILFDVIHQVGFERIALANINKLLKREKNGEICDR